jgi:hypothetical protein
LVKVLYISSEWEEFGERFSQPEDGKDHMHDYNEPMITMNNA